MLNYTMLKLSSFTIFFNYHFYLRIQLLFTLIVPCKHKTVPLFPIHISLLHKLESSKTSKTFLRNSHSTIKSSVIHTHTSSSCIKEWTTFTSITTICIDTDLTLIATLRKTTINIRFYTFINIYERRKYIK